MTYKEYLEHSKKVKVSKNFTQYDICHSETALKLGIDNTPDLKSWQNATILIKNILEPIRSYYNKPLLVSCMFRSKELNKRVGGASTSQHLVGQACDFIISGVDCKKVFNDIISGRITLGKTKLCDIIDQCIYENTWIHISYSMKQRRKMFLVYKNNQYKVTTKEI